MRQTEERYISLLTDFGFKRIFGTKLNKSLLISFLNSLFAGEQVIRDVKYLNSEHVGDVLINKSAIFDVCCVNEQGEMFVVEMQNAYLTYFKESSLYNASFPLCEKISDDVEWKFDYGYVVALLNPIFRDAMANIIKETASHNSKLMFKCVEISNIDKSVDELHTDLDKWLYVIRNLSSLEYQPINLQNEVFNQLFEVSMLPNL